MPESTNQPTAAQLRDQYNDLARRCTELQAKRKKLRPELEAKVKAAMKIADTDLNDLIKAKGEVAKQLREAEAREAAAASDEHAIACDEEAAKIASEGLADETAVVSDPALYPEAVTDVIAEAPKPEPSTGKRRR